MAKDADKALDVAAKAAEAAKNKLGAAGDIKDALKGMRKDVNFLAKTGEQLNELVTDIGKKKLPPREILQRIGGFVAIAALTWILTEEDLEHYEEGQEDVEEGETLEETEAEQEREEEEEPEEVDPMNDEEQSVQQSLTNMYAIRYYRKNGSVYENKNQLGKICVKENAIPSKFIRKGSRALFAEGVGTFEYFKKNVTKKLVHKSVTDPAERLRQAAVILSCCAVGRFQIVPTFHFEGKGWATREIEGDEGGEDGGLRAMYNYIRSTDRQISLFKRILEGRWNTYKDVGTVAVDYYSGKGAAYKKNPKSPYFQNMQYGNHPSIDSYAQKARNRFNQFKREIPGLRDIDYVAMAIESIEGGRGIIYQRAAQGQGISDMQVA